MDKSKIIRFKVEGERMTTMEWSRRRNKIGEARKFIYIMVINRMIDNGSQGIHIGERVKSW
jgi:hypothetical protein